jgi:hypothetical protein
MTFGLIIENETLDRGTLSERLVGQVLAPAP